MSRPRKPRARGAGEGTIRQRADGRWEAKLTTGYDAQGRQQRQSVYGKTRAEAAAKLADLQVRHHRGEAVQAGKIPLITYLTQFARARAPYVRPRTQSNHDLYLKIIARFPIGQIHISDLKARHAAAFYVTLGAEYSDSVIHHVRNFINQALKDAIRNEILSASTALEAQAPRREKEEAARALTPPEVAALTAVTDQARMGTLIRTILALGLRIGEALALTWDDYDPAAGTLTVQRTGYRSGKTTRTGPTKTRAGRRTLYVTPALAARWAEWKETLHVEAQQPGYTPTRLIFPNGQGQPAAYSLIRRDFARYAARAGLGAVRLHDLRHTFATRLTHNGADPRTVAALLGHTDARVTLAIYTHAHAETSKAALLTLNDQDNGEG